MRDHAFASWLGTVTVALGLAAVAHGQVPTGLIPIGRPRVQEGLRVTAAYMVGAAPLEPAARPAARPVEGTLTIHLEVEVEAVHDNPYGLEADDAVPYLRIPFALTHGPTGRRVEGRLAPMVSQDGFHYGANVALPGPGAYTLSIEVRPPEGLARHTGPRRGVRPWWRPFTLSWRFTHPPA